MPLGHAAADARAQSPATPLAALWRLRSYLRPYWGRLIIMLAAACASVAIALVIPLLIKALIVALRAVWWRNLGRCGGGGATATLARWLARPVGRPERTGGGCP